MPSELRSAAVDGDPAPVTSGFAVEGDPAAAAAFGDQNLLLEIHVNGRNIGKVGEFVLIHSRLMVRPAELRDLGFKVPAQLVPDARGLILLSDLPGVTWSLDLRNQVLEFKALDSALIPVILTADQRSSQVGPRHIESGTGLTLNHDVVANYGGGQFGGSGSFDLRGFSPMGTFNSDWMNFAGRNSGSPNKVSTLRLDTAYSMADVNSMRRYSAGDFINPGLSWNRPVHMEGLQARSDFSMRPDLVTFPLPSLSGSAAVPSTVNVLVNGNQVLSQSVDGGPFSISQLPVVSGAGVVTMNMTNAQGQQVSVSQPFYGGSTLLAPGLQTYGGQVGLVRRNWGTVSNDYGKIAGTGYYRRGLTQTLTLEAEGEGTPGATMGGVGGALIVANLAMINVDVAASTGAGKLGDLFSVGAQHVGLKIGLGGSAQFSNSSYRDVAAMNGSGIVRRQLSAYGSYSTHKYGSGSLAYAGEDTDAPTVVINGTIGQSQQSHILSANYTVQIHHISFYATEYKSLDNGGNSSTQIGMTIPLGRRRSMSVSGSIPAGGQVQVQQSISRIGDWGYNGYVSEGAANHEFGQVEYKSPVGLFTAGVDYGAGSATLRMESQSAVSFVDHSVFLSNTVYDSFAVVDTGPIQNVHVLSENRDVGITNKAGKLLVTDLRSFDLNRIGIDPNDVPADATLENPKREIRPQDRSGVVVRFPIQYNNSALLKLVDATGAALPVGSTAVLRSTGVSYPIGYDGEAYIEKLDEHNQLDVTRPNGKHCFVAFDYLATPGDIPTIGPLRCEGKTAK
jgi:outer membrane usher protein